MLGDGEEVTNELMDLLISCKKAKTTKYEFLKKAAQIKGVYVPSLYEIEYNDDKTIKTVNAIDGAPEKVTKRPAKI